MKDIAKEIGVSSTYISEIERNMKVPSDTIIKKIAVTYQLDEKSLYKGFKIVPDHMIYELTSENGLYELIYELSEDVTFSRKQKDTFYKEVKKLYREMFGKGQ